jgi:NADH:ubiquinone oxidoreductase subunit H
MYVLDLIFFIIIFLLLAICVLVGVVFIVLLERRVLGYVHIRKGPNRVSKVKVKLSCNRPWRPIGL